MSYALNAASASKKTSPRFTAFLQRLLLDQRVCQKLTGEMRGYASEGLRLCDWALNILWSREPESARPPAYPLDVNYSTEKRDQLIADYARKYGVPLSEMRMKIDATRTSPSLPDPEESKRVIPLRASLPTHKAPEPAPSSDPEPGRPSTIATTFGWLWWVAGATIAMAAVVAWSVRRGWRGKIRRLRE